ADGVGAEHEEQLTVRRCERDERVVRDRGLAPLDLDRRGLDAVDAVDGGGDQRQAVGGRGDHLAALLPRVTGHDHEDPVQAQRGPGVGRGHDVADVHRVERAPEDTDALDPGSLRAAQRRPGHPGPVHRAGTPVSCTRPTLSRMPLDNPSPSSAAHVLVRVWLPDRPGALGLVASRIGAVRDDTAGLRVLEGGRAVAVAEFAVTLPDPALAPTLVREIEEAAGASVEEVRAVGHFPDARLDALESAAALCEAATVDELHTALVAQTKREFLADWTALVNGARVLAHAGDDTPSPDALDALVAGTCAWGLVSGGVTGPDDLAVAGFTDHDAALLLGRAGHPLRRRERGQLLALVRIADRAWQLLGEYNVPSARDRHAPA